MALCYIIVQLRPTLTIETRNAILGPLKRITPSFGRNFDFEDGNASIQINFPNPEQSYTRALNFVALMIKCRKHFKNMLMTEITFTEQPWRAYRRSVENREIGHILRRSLPGNSPLSASTALVANNVTVALNIERVSKVPLLAASLRMHNMAQWCFDTENRIKLITRSPLKGATFDKISVDRDPNAISPETV